jgi:hypothetical protein
MTSILKVDTIQDQSGNNIINENADTITIGASGDTVNIVGTLQNGGTNFLQGITMADMWRITANLNVNNADITSNWERADTVQYGTIGTGLTESSGLFSFPQTGIYYIHFITYFDSSVGNPVYIGVQLKLSSDGGSNFGTAIQTYSAGINATEHGIVTLNYIMDVTNISNDRFKFTTDIEASDTANFAGSTTQQRTGFTIFRLGDT